MPRDTGDTQRADLWLFQTRFFKTRVLASSAITGGHLRINGAKVLKPGHVVRAGDVLTFVQATRVRVVRVLSLPDRRGPAAEAATQYAEIVADNGVPPLTTDVEQPDAVDGSGRKDGLSPPPALD